MGKRICPDCGSSQTAKVLWGELPPPTEPDAYDGVILGGCCIPLAEDGTEPTFGCHDCGAYFTRRGQVTGRASEL